MTQRPCGCATQAKSEPIYRPFLQSGFRGFSEANDVKGQRLKNMHLAKNLIFPDKTRTSNS